MNFLYAKHQWTPVEHLFLLGHSLIVEKILLQYQISLLEVYWHCNQAHQEHHSIEIAQGQDG